MCAVGAWLWACGGHDRQHPAATVKTFKVPDVSPRRALADATVRALLAQYNRSSVKGARDYALVVLLLYLGLRRLQVARLTCGQIGEERGHNTVRIAGKAGKVRLPPLPFCHLPLRYDRGRSSACKSEIRAL
jgi:site-specific recombinase XerD